MSEWIACPSLSSSRRSPPGDWMTRAYWYSVSASSTTRPASLCAFTIPTGSSSAPATAAGTMAHRARAMPSRPTMARASAKVRNVRRVPTSGMSSSALRNVPASEPNVEMAYRRPEVLPASSISSSARRIANGETMPSTSTGVATSASTPMSEPTNAPAATVSSASTARERKG